MLLSSEVTSARNMEEVNTNIHLAAFPCDSPRQVRHRAVGHLAPLHADHAGHGVGAAQPAELGQAHVAGQGAAQAAVGRHHRGLHQHHALAPHAHQPAPLQRVHRVPGQGARDLHDGARRTHPVHAVHRQPETDLQGQKETHDAGEGALRLSAATFLPTRVCLFLLFFCFLGTSGGKKERERTSK